jgi:hypothetical protein
MQQFSILSLFVLGTLLWAFCPIFERLAGDRAASGALGGGLAFLVGAVEVGLDRPNFISSLSLLEILLGVVVYLMFASLPMKRAPEKSEPVECCIAKLLSGSAYTDSFRKWKLRTRLDAEFRVAPSNSALRVSAWASGRAYYGLYYSQASHYLTPSVDVVGTEDGASTCRIHAQVRGQTQYSESPLSIRIDHVITASGCDLSIRTSVEAGVSASCGSLGVSAGVGASVDLPSAALSTKADMGTFLWCCSPDSLATHHTRP